MGMTALVIIHQVLNQRWYGALFIGKYNPYRTAATALNILLLFSFALTAFCGMSMSTYAVPFLYGMARVSFVRRMHLSMSHWAFVLMGLHLGMHIPAMAAGLQLKEKTKAAAACLFACIGGIGFWLFLRNGMPAYLFFRVPFAFLDYEKAGFLVFLENLLMLSFWAFAGTQIAWICRNAAQGAETKKRPLLPAAAIMASVIIGITLARLFPPAEGQAPSWEPDWSVPQAEVPGEEESAGTQEVPQALSSAAPDMESVDDGFVRIEGGSFLMGSPASENWRIDDETQHEVAVGSFFMDPFETTQGEYAQLMGENPSSFPGDELPVENISWTDAVLYANAKSEAAGLTPAYSVTDTGVSWDLSADGYRLPTRPNGNTRAGRGRKDRSIRVNYPAPKGYWA